MGKGKQVRKLRTGAVANAIEILLVLKKKVTRSQKHEHEYGEDTVVVKSLWKSVVIEKLCNRGSLAIARRPGYDYKGTKHTLSKHPKSNSNNHNARNAA